MNRLYRFGALAVALLLFLFLISPWLLATLGATLVNDQAPRKADAALVLAGDSLGQRIAKGADLRRQGFVPLVYVSGPSGAYGHTEDELAIGFATKLGFPPEYFAGLPNQADSTADEARLLLPILRARGVRHLLLVTSNYHSARAVRTFRRADPTMDITPVAAPDKAYRAQSWWHTRQGRKTFFFEATKTIADFMGL